jgi:hypothetical protein
MLKSDIMQGILLCAAMIMALIAFDEFLTQ